jgi:parvulin-like peptidyl-prolyl isomerase
MKESELYAKFSKLNIRDVLKGMGNGDISLPVRDGAVSYIFQLVSREDGKPFEKSEALKVIGAKVAVEKARAMARLKAEDALKDKGLKFSRETEFFPRKTGAIPGVGPVPKESVDVLALTKGQTYQKPVEINGKYYVFAYNDEQAPDKAQWEKDKENYRRMFAATSRNTYLNSIKEEMKKTVKIKINWEVL